MQEKLLRNINSHQNRSIRLMMKSKIDLSEHFIRNDELRIMTSSSIESKMGFFLNLRIVFS